MAGSFFQIEMIVTLRFVSVVNFIPLVFQHNTYDLILTTQALCT